MFAGVIFATDPSGFTLITTSASRIVVAMTNWSAFVQVTPVGVPDVGSSSVKQPTSCRRPKSPASRTETVQIRSAPHVSRSMSTLRAPVGEGKFSESAEQPQITDASSPRTATLRNQRLGDTSAS